MTAGDVGCVWWLDRDRPKCIDVKIILFTTIAMFWKLVIVISVM